ncbi:hypothetical protein LZ30DRAFT_166786 [Colletotrichum cereale]|nr:hypothetical protein LZ30DRAFT_166786 [Colletotrichum cereale]
MIHRWHSIFPGNPISCRQTPAPLRPTMAACCLRSPPAYGYGTAQHHIYFYLTLASPLAKVGTQGRSGLGSGLRIAPSRLHHSVFKVKQDSEILPHIPVVARYIGLPPQPSQGPTLDVQTSHYIIVYFYCERLQVGNEQQTPKLCQPTAGVVWLVHHQLIAPISATCRTAPYIQTFGPLIDSH